MCIAFTQFLVWRTNVLTSKLVRTTGLEPVVMSACKADAVAAVPRSHFN